MEPPKFAINLEANSIPFSVPSKVKKPNNYEEEYK